MLLQWPITSRRSKTQWPCSHCCPLKSHISPLISPLLSSAQNQLLKQTPNSRNLYSKSWFIKPNPFSPSIFWPKSQKWSQSNKFNTFELLKLAEIQNQLYNPMAIIQYSIRISSKDLSNVNPKFDLSKGNLIKNSLFIDRWQLSLNRSSI